MDHNPQSNYYLFKERKEQLKATNNMNMDNNSEQ